MLNCEYFDKRDELRSKLDEDLKQLNLEYAKSNGQFDIGDIIQPTPEHLSPIMVEEVLAVAPNELEPDGLYNNSCLPLVIYKGTPLTKELQPYNTTNKTKYVDNDHMGLRLIKSSEGKVKVRNKDRIGTYICNLTFVNRADAFTEAALAFERMGYFVEIKDIVVESRQQQPYDWVVYTDYYIKINKNNKE